jgi:hypothetical protein
MARVERLLRLAPSASWKQKRLLALLAGRPAGPELAAQVEDAQTLGSLELAGLSLTWDDVLACRRGEPSPEPIAALQRARRAVERDAPVSIDALRAWHRAAVPGGGSFRTAEKGRADGPPPSPVAFIESRLRIAEEWLSAESARELEPARLAALAMARVVEILPFEAGNGRVARLAASHLLVRGGGRPPILVSGDERRLVQCLQAAFQFELEPLATLLEEAEGRALDVMLQTLESAR